MSVKRTHTSGPWKAYRKRLRPTIGPVIREVQTRRGETVAGWQGFDGLDMPKAQIDANVRLMAAAPELLDACKTLLHIFDRGLGADTIGRKFCDDARAAIQKATGATPPPPSEV
jgi:hypothetical protein